MVPDYKEQKYGGACALGKGEPSLFSVAGIAMMRFYPAGLLRGGFVEWIHHRLERQSSCCRDCAAAQVVLYP